MRNTILTLSKNDERAVAKKIFEMARIGIHGPQSDGRSYYAVPVFQTGEEKRIINLALVQMDVYEKEMNDDIEDEKKSPGTED